MNALHAIAPTLGGMTRYVLRVFELEADGSTEPPVPLPDREVEASSVDEARERAAVLFEAERRPVRSIGFLAGGCGLVAYVLPPLPPAAPTLRRRRPRRR